MKEAVEAVREGKIVGLPTDTVYGVGVDPTNEEAVQLLFDLKGRPVGKPLGLLVASTDQARTMVEITDDVRSLAEEHWPGPLTIVGMAKVVMARWVGDQQRLTVGVRVPDHPVALGLLEKVGPMAVTSANQSGEPEALNHDSARRELGDDVAVYLEGASPGGEASTVIDVSGAYLSLIREGPVQIATR